MASGSVKSKESRLAVGGRFLRSRPEISIGKQVVYLGRAETPGNTSWGEKKLFHKEEQLRKGLLQSQYY